MRTNRSILIALSFVVATTATGQWNQFHGNAQRTGASPYSGPVNPQRIWSVDIGGPIITSPVLAPDGTIYVGPTQQENVAKPGIVVTAVSPTGQIKWQFKTKFIDHDLGTMSTPAVGAGGLVYFGAPEGAFYAVNPDGTVNWRYQAANPVIQSPVIAGDGSVYVGIDGKLTKFSASGDVLWQTPVLGDWRQSGGPSLGLDGTVYWSAATQDIGSSMYAFSPSGTQLWKLFLNQYFWPLAPPTIGPDGTIYTAAQGLHAINPNGTQKWYSEPTYGMNTYGALTVDPSGAIYTTAYVYTFKVNPANGNTVWRRTLTQDNSRLGSSYSSILVDVNKRLYYGLGTGKRSAIDYEKSMEILNGTTGSLLKLVQFPEIPGTSSPALKSDGTLYIGNLDGKLYALHD